MPNLVAPPVKRIVQGGVAKKERESLPPPLQRVATVVDRRADKNKWSK